MTRASVALLCLLPIAWLALRLFGVGSRSSLLFAAALYALVLGFESALDSMQTAARQRIVVAWHDALGAWIRYPVAAALIMALGASGTVALLGFALSTVVVLASQLLLYRHRILSLTRDEPKPDADAVRLWISRMQRYSWPFATWGIFTWLQMSSDRWALQVTAGSEAVGLYSAIYQIGYFPIIVITNAVVQLIAPILFERAGDGTSDARLAAARSLTARIVWAAIGLAVICAVIAYALRGILVQVLLAPQYRVTANILPLLVLSGGLFAAGQVAALSAMANLETKRLLVPKIVTAILGMTFNLVGAIVLGINGVVAASVAFSAIYLIWVWKVSSSKDASQTVGPKPLQ